MDARQMLESFSYAERPTEAFDSDRKVLPPDPIRLRLIEFERLDMCYDFGKMREAVDNDEDVGAWWVYWVYQTLFVWRFLFAGDISADGQWLRREFRDTVGERLYKHKIDNTKDYLKSIGETVAENI